MTVPPNRWTSRVNNFLSDCFLFTLTMARSSKTPFCVHSEMKMLDIHSRQMPNRRFVSLCVLPSVANTSAGETLPGSISLVVVERWLRWRCMRIHINNVSSWLSEPFGIVVTYCIRLLWMVDGRRTFSDFLFIFAASLDQFSRSWIGLQFNECVFLVGWSSSLRIVFPVRREVE